MQDAIMVTCLPMMPIHATDGVAIAGNGHCSEM